MKKILMILSVASLMTMVACNRSDKSRDTSMQQREEARDYEDDRTIEREEAIDYETDRMGRPVDEVQVDEVERRIED